MPELLPVLPAEPGQGQLPAWLSPAGAPSAVLPAAVSAAVQVLELLFLPEFLWLLQFPDMPRQPVEPVLPKALQSQERPVLYQKPVLHIPENPAEYRSWTAVHRR